MRAEDSWVPSIQINMLKNTIDINKDKLFIPTTAKEMLIDGYYVGTMKAAQAAKSIHEKAEEEEGDEEEGKEADTPTGMYSLMARVRRMMHFLS